MAKIMLSTPNSPYSATLNTEAMDVKIEEAYLGVRFVSDGGEILSVSMRDGGFEFSYQQKSSDDPYYFEAKAGMVTKVE